MSARAPDPCFLAPGWPGRPGSPPGAVPLARPGGPRAGLRGRRHRGQSIATSGRLKDRIPPVTGYTFLMAKRFELAPTVSFRLPRRLLDASTCWVSPPPPLHRDAGPGAPAPATRSRPSAGRRRSASQVEPYRSPTKEELDGKGPGQINLVTALDFEWTPLYGKISLLAEGFAHFNLYLIAGPMVVQYQAPLDANLPGARRPGPSGARWGWGCGSSSTVGWHPFRATGRHLPGEDRWSDRDRGRAVPGAQLSLLRHRAVLLLPWQLERG